MIVNQTGISGNFNFFFIEKQSNSTILQTKFNMFYKCRFVDITNQIDKDEYSKKWFLFSKNSLNDNFKPHLLLCTKDIKKNKKKKMTK